MAVNLSEHRLLYLAGGIPGHLCEYYLAGSLVSGKLGAEDVDALALLNAKFIDLDACTFTDNSLASSISASSNIEAMSLPAGLTKEQVNAAGAQLATDNHPHFGSVASTNTQSVTRDVDAYYVKDSDGYATEEECTNGITETGGTITGLVPRTKMSRR